MKIPLAPVEYLSWMKRMFLLIDLLVEGASHSGQAARPNPFHRPIETTSVMGWFDRVTEALHSTEQTAGVVIARSQLEEAARGDNSNLAQPIEKAIDVAGNAILAAMGAWIRQQGDDAVPLAIVAVVYRADAASNGTIIQFTNPSYFGINTSAMKRIIAQLVQQNIFQTAGAAEVVRITERGRQWFETQLEKQPDGATITPIRDSNTPTSSGRQLLNVIEVTAHLSFMRNAELHEIAISLLSEINNVIAADASLATMVLCGSAVETMVLDLAEQMPSKLTFATKTNWADSISLPKIAAELTCLGLLTDTVKALAIADHRDLIHPNRRRKAKIRIDGKAARAMISLLEIDAHDLFDASKDGRLATLSGAVGAT